MRLRRIEAGMSDEKNADPLPWVWQGHSEYNQMRADTNLYRTGKKAGAEYVYRPRPEFGTPSPATGEDKE